LAFCSCGAHCAKPHKKSWLHGHPQGLVAVVFGLRTPLASPVGWTGVMSKPQPPRHRTTIWPTQNRALGCQGSILILIDPQRQWRAGSAGKLGRPVGFPDTAIRLCLSVKVPVKLPLPTATRLPSSRSARSPPPRSSASPHINGERGNHTSPLTNATLPRGDDRPPCVGQWHPDQGWLPFGTPDSLRYRYGTPQTSTGSTPASRRCGRSSQSA